MDGAMMNGRAMNGLWMAHFDAGAAHGNGIVVLNSGEILGGDFSHTWTGTFQREGSSLRIRVQVAPYGLAQEAEVEAAERPFMVTLTGRCTEGEANLSGHPDESDVAVNIRMRKAA